MAKGKGKGSTWERDVSKTLTKWLTGVEKPYVWWRAPGSGAIATVSEANKELSGDIISLRPEGAFLTDRFSIECKVGYPNSNFHKHLKGVKNDEIKDFWVQCVRDANRADKLPMLIYKKKGNPALVGVPFNLCPVVDDKLSKLMSLSLVWEDGTGLIPVRFYCMDTFFQIISPEDIKSI